MASKHDDNIESLCKKYEREMSEMVKNHNPANPFNYQHFALLNRERNRLCGPINGQKNWRRGVYQLAFENRKYISKRKSPKRKSPKRKSPKRKSKSPIKKRRTRSDHI